MRRSRDDEFGGGRLLRNTVYTLAGFAAPALVALLAVPSLVGALGTHRFGVLALIWTAVGYFGLSNLGIGRALTQALAARGAGERDEESAILIRTGLATVLLLGTVAGALLALVTPLLVESLLRIPPSLRPEARTSFHLLALALPFLASNSLLTGVLEARHRFDLVSLVAIPTSLVTWVGPLAVVPFSSSLVPVIGLLAAGRVLAWGINLALCARLVPALRQGLAVDRAAVAPLLRFGGWTTLSGMVSPVMVYMDRFAVGALLSVAAVAYYATAQEVVLRLGIVSGSIVTALFPAISGSYSRHPERVTELLDRGLRLVLLAVFPISLLLVSFADEALRLWLGGEFAGEGGRALRWLAGGLLINGIAKVATTLLQAVGKPEVTARLHLVELPLYLLLLAVLLPRFGIEGAAMAWTVRMAGDATAHFWLLRRVLPQCGPAVSRLVPPGAVAILLLGLASALGGNVLAKGGGVALTLGVLAVLAWRAVLTEGEREGVRRRLWPAAPATDPAG